MTALQIRDLRLALGMTQNELARQIGTSVRAVQSWEQGWRRPTGIAEHVLLTLQK